MRIFVRFMEKERIILGIDPGTQLLGFGIVRAQGKKVQYVDKIGRASCRERV